MPFFCKCSKTTQLGGAVMIMAASVALSNSLVDAGQDGNMGRQAAQQDFTLETMLTRDLTYAARSNPTNDERWDKIQSQVNKPAPSFNVGDWQSLDSTMKGGTLESMRGDIVVIDFWGTWCPPCRAAMPKNYELAKKYAGKDVRFVGISTVNGSDRMSEVAEQIDARFPLTVDNEDKTAEAYGVQWWPYYVVVDRDGIVRAAGLTPGKLETAIERLLVLQPPKDKDETETTPRRRNR